MVRMITKSILFLFTSFFVLAFNMELINAEMNTPKHWIDVTLKACDGDWYDGTENKVLTVKNGYINGCRILSGFNSRQAGIEAGQSFRINEKTGVREIDFEWFVGKSGYSNYMVLDGKKLLHRKENKRIVVDEIFVGMAMSSLKGIYGEGKKINNKESESLLGTGNGIYDGGIYYKNKGILVRPFNDCIGGIYVLKGSRVKINDNIVGEKNLMSI